MVGPWILIGTSGRVALEPEWPTESVHQRMAFKFLMRRNWQWPASAVWSTPGTIPLRVLIRQISSGEHGLLPLRCYDRFELLWTLPAVRSLELIGTSKGRKPRRSRAAF